MPLKTWVRSRTVTGQQGGSWYTTGGSAAPDADSSMAIRVDSIIGSQGHRSWGNTPGYRSLSAQARRSLAPQGLDFRNESRSGWLSAASLYSLVSEDGIQGRKFQRSSWNLSTGVLAYPSGFYGGELITDDDLFVAARGKLKDYRSWSAPIFLAEMGKTSKMIVSSAEKIVDTLVMVKKFDIAGLNRMYRSSSHRPPPPPGSTPADVWLQYKYGWMPLLKDVYDASVALPNITQRWATPEAQSNVMVRLSRSKNENVELAFQISPDIVGHSLRMTAQSKRLNCRFFVNDKESYAAASMGLLNPLQVAWELVPFSFVADWFAPIGSYINSLDAGIGITITSCWVSQKEEQADSVKSATSAFFNDYCHLSFERSYVSVTRRSVQGLPQAVPSNLTVRPNLGGAQLTSALALMRQITSRR